MKEHREPQIMPFNQLLDNHLYLHDHKMRHSCRVYWEMMGQAFRREVLDNPDYPVFLMAWNKHKDN